MDSKVKPDVDAAYSLETPEDCVRLYRNWADTYDEDFVAHMGYQSYIRIAEIFVEQFSAAGVVLDVGCGTGVVGVELKRMGIGTIDGIDISDAMLAKAGEKAVNGEPAYRHLIAADLTRSLEFPNASYAGLISAGTFTHGHLGPGALNELWRVAAPGALCTFGVRTTHFDKAGFAGKLATDVRNGLISKPVLHKIDMYDEQKVDSEHVGDQAYVVVCRVLT